MEMNGSELVFPLGRPCRVNHCDDEHVCVRRKDVDWQYRCVPKNYFKQQ